MHRRALRILLAAACVGLLPLRAAAAEAPGSAVDRELAALKADALELGRELQATERAARFPGGTQTSIYVAVRVSGFLLDRVSVRVDGGEPQRHEYSGSEALSLLKDDGWHRLARLRLEPGSHRLQAEFSGRFHDARAGEPAISGRIEAAFDKGAGELDLVLPIVRSNPADPRAPTQPVETRRLTAPRTAWLLAPERVELAPDSKAIGGPDDPRLRAALFLKNDYRHFSALVELADLQQATGRSDALPASFWLLMAECYLGFGMEAQAGALYQRLAAGARDPQALARAQLQLA
ncbi:MAG: hypothetical protein ACRES8_06890, partial [Nevskiaceae bacterium]